MWIFSLKMREDGSIEGYKARLVAKGYSQRPGIEFFEAWAQVGRTAILRALFALAARFTWETWNLDISTTFLDCELSETVYSDLLHS
jgi:hypothetical protein